MANTVQIYLPDTNILVHMARQSPLYSKMATQYPLAPKDTRSILNSIVVGEIRAFARRSQWGEQKQRIIEDFFSRSTLIPLETAGLVAAYVEIDKRSQKAGRTMGDHDMWIAATAQVMGATLLITDKDFDHLNPGYIDLIWINPNTP